MAVLLEADNIRVEYGNLIAVAGVSFAMQAGDLLGLIGPNGAGKSTLLRVLAGLQEPTSGAARIMGHDILLESDAVRGHVAFAPDDPPAYEEMTIEQFLRFVAELHRIDGREADERMDYWLEQVWLNDKRNEKIGKLSKGMRQRVTIAQTLIPNPPVILMDEPSSGLDPAGRIQLRQVIASLAAQGKAVVVSSHILADLEEYCTHIAIIEHGRLLRYSHVDELAHTDTRRTVYRLAVAGDEDATAAIMAVEGVSNVVRNSDHYLLEHDAGREMAAMLLRSLIEGGVQVAAFAPVKANLEEIYLKTGVKQVD